MTSKQFHDAVIKLWGSVYASADPLGISLRQAQRYDAGTEVAAPVANQLKILLDHVRGLKDERKRLIDQLAFFDRPGARIGDQNGDHTQAWKTILRDRIAELEDLLRNHPAGFVPQI
ncbi:hypothetical protein [Bradyrhizobium sp. CCBAU 11386]|uniref:hypothetical protein n=1 Tax=Bradyrhizobium sp. CCBAU 11386 TaxID=1630837 RepID=UPI0023021D96|nr:hypothetical protein [Bradyrhizobium sp. CCBAU 11386]